MTTRKHVLVSVMTGMLALLGLSASCAQNASPSDASTQTDSQPQEQRQPRLADSWRAYVKTLGRTPTRQDYDQFVSNFEAKYVIPHLTSIYGHEQQQITTWKAQFELRARQYGGSMFPGQYSNIDATRTAAEKGDPEAEFELGYNYLIDKTRIPGDERKSLKWLKLSAQQGLSKAQGLLAAAYFYGFDGDGEIKKNESEAIKWAIRASGQGDLSANITLARIYTLGTQTKHDETKAISYLRPALEKHDGDAEGLLANLYLTVEGGRDYGQALNWAERAVNDGETTGDGRAALGAIYLWGLGVPKDYKKGMLYLNNNGSHFASTYLSDIQNDINKENAALLQRLRSMPPMPTPAPPSPAGLSTLNGDSTSYRAPSNANIPTYGGSGATTDKYAKPTRTTESAGLYKEDGSGSGYMTCYYTTSGGYQFTTTSSGSCPGAVEVDPQSGQAW